MFRLAEHLHKTVAEIEAMDWIEFRDWQAYFEVKRRKHG